MPTQSVAQASPTLGHLSMPASTVPHGILMRRFVVDASVSLCWYFEEQKSAYTETLLERLAEGDRAVAPA